MKKLCSFLFVLFFSLSSHCEKWVDPQDEVFSNKKGELFTQASLVRNTLDSWDGNNSQLIESHRLLEKLLGQDDGFAPAYLQFGRLYMRLGYVNSRKYKVGEFATAESSLKHAIKLYPEYAEAYTYLGSLYTIQKDFLKAKSALSKAELIGFDSPWLEHYWGEYYRSIGNDKEAVKYHQRVVDRETTITQAVNSSLGKLARLYSQLKMKEQAIEAYDKTTELKPNSAWVWGNYASYLLFTFGEVDQAIIKGEKALSIMNYGVGRLTVASAYCTKWATLKGNNPTEAQQYLDKALNYISDPKTIANETSKYKFTQACSRALQRYVIS